MNNNNEDQRLAAARRKLEQIRLTEDRKSAMDNAERHLQELEAELELAKSTQFSTQKERKLELDRIGRKIRRRRERILDLQARAMVDMMDGDEDHTSMMNSNFASSVPGRVASSTSTGGAAVAPRDEDYDSDATVDMTVVADAAATSVATPTTTVAKDLRLVTGAGHAQPGSQDPSLLAMVSAITKLTEEFEKLTERVNELNETLKGASKH